LALGAQDRRKADLAHAFQFDQHYSAMQRGYSVTIEATDPIGSPEKPLSDAQLEAKFRDCARNAVRLFIRRRLDAALTAIRHLHTLEDVGELLKSFAE
jgi:2-methylcitrate dehydratase PrpD